MAVAALVAGPTVHHRSCLTLLSTTYLVGYPAILLVWTQPPYSRMLFQKKKNRRHIKKLLSSRINKTRRNRRQFVELRNSRSSQKTENPSRIKPKSNILHPTPLSRRKSWWCNCTEETNPKKTRDTEWGEVISATNHRLQRTAATRRKKRRRLADARCIINQSIVDLALTYFSRQEILIVCIVSLSLCYFDLWSRESEK